MSPLYLDIGNSFMKLAKPNGSDWTLLFDGELHRFEELCSFIDTSINSKKIILSSVRKDITQKLRENLKVQGIHELKTSDIPRKMLDYKTPQTLGLDRFLVCLAAWKESGEKNTIVVDAGSACTVDLMTSDGVYKGGVIMPGLKIIRQTMKERLPELPEVTELIPAEWPGKSTRECLEWGVNGGLMIAIQGFIKKYQTTVDKPSIYITGGDAKKLMEWMGEKENIHYRKNLIWDGLEELAKIAQK